MSLHQDIKSQMTEALKARETERLGVLRGLLTSFTNELVSKKRKPDEELSDEEVLGVVARAVKQRKDSIEQFKKGGRKDLAETEERELVILEAYLPEQMSREEVKKFVSSKLEGKNLDPGSKGQVMGEIMRELKGKVDGSLVKEVIEEMFG